MRAKVKRQEMSEDKSSQSINKIRDSSIHRRCQRTSQASLSTRLETAPCTGDVRGQVKPVYQQNQRQLIAQEMSEDKSSQSINKIRDSSMHRRCQRTSQASLSTRLETAPSTGDVRGQVKPVYQQDQRQLHAQEMSEDKSSQSINNIRDSSMHRRCQRTSQASLSTKLETADCTGDVRGQVKPVYQQDQRQLHAQEMSEDKSSQSINKIRDS